MSDDYKLLRNFMILMAVVCIILLLGQFGVILGMIKCDNECSYCCEIRK